MQSREEFRLEFYRRMREIDDERSYGSILAVAEANPEFLKSDYAFLGKKELPRKEKAHILKAVYEIAEKSGDCPFDYLFDRNVAISLNLKHVLDGIMNGIRKKTAEISRYVSEAESEGIDAREERNAVDELFVRDVLSGALLEFYKSVAPEPDERIQ